MDVDSSAGGNGSRRKVDIPAVAEAPLDIIPLELYDSARAKIAANLRWLFAKAYGIGEQCSLHPVLPGYRQGDAGKRKSWFFLCFVL